MPSVKSDNYAFQERMRCVEKMDKILEKLPKYCSDCLYYKLNGPKKAQSRTVLAYAGDYSVFFDYLKKRNPLCKNMEIVDISTDILSHLTVDDIEEYYEYLSMYTKDGKVYTNQGPAQKRKINSISSLFNYLVKKSYLSSNPCLLMETERIKEKPIIALAADEQNRLINIVENNSDIAETSRSQKIREKYTKYRDIAIIYLFLGSGIRVSELVGLNMDDIDLEHNNMLIIRKGGKMAKLSFSNEVSGAIREYIDESLIKLCFSDNDVDSSALFLSVHKKRISVRQVENIVKGYAKIALGENTKLSCHKLRSTFATQLLSNSHNIALVAEQLGHADVNTTKKRYSKVENLNKVPDYVSIKRDES